MLVCSRRPGLRFDLYLASGKTLGVLMVTAQERLNQILPSWYDLLTQWSQDGSLVAAATDALMLDSSNAKPDAKGQLQSLTSQWSAGNFKSLPEIVLLSNADISGAQGAYAASTGKIYLNANWLLTADQDWIQRVLTEELGHHLDAQLNLMDTPGDEGELISGTLYVANQTRTWQGNWIPAENDDGFAYIGETTVAAEQSSIVTSAQNLVSYPGCTGWEFRNEGSFAALKADGSVVTWGASSAGGDSSSVTSKLAGGVSQIFSTVSAFAALKADGSVVTWGNSLYGGDSTAVAATLSSGVTQIFSSRSAFAALKADGSVVTWGDWSTGGDSSAKANSLTTGVIRVFSNAWGGFAALKADGSVVTWGNPDNGGDSSSVAGRLNSGVIKIFSTGYAFAALKDDGSVVTWGYQTYGGDSTSKSAELASGVTSISANLCGFAAIRSNGSVVTWGLSADYGLADARLNSGVTQVFSSQQAFAALKDDGSVVTWGDSIYGGDSSAVAADLTSGVTRIFATDYAFAALKSDGSVITWGNLNNNSTQDITSPPTNSLSSGVISIFSTSEAFAALKADGSVVTWGHAYRGGNSSAVASHISSGVKQVFANQNAFAALKADGSVVTWGAPDTYFEAYGADSSAVSSQLSSGVVALANPFTDDRLVATNQGQATFSVAGAANPAAPAVNETLTASNTGADPDGNGTGGFSYTWQTSTDGTTWTPITGATTNAYKITSAEEGKQIRLRVTYTDAQTFNEIVSVAAGTVTVSTPAPTIGNDNLIATTSGGLISGVPSTDTTLGRGSNDKLSGNSGVDTFVLGDSRGAFYNDGVTTNGGTGDYGFITSFSTGSDKIQLAGTASRYLLNTATIADLFDSGVSISGVGIYLNDGTGRGSKSAAWDSKDELVGFIANQTTTTLGSLAGSNFTYQSIGTTPIAGGTQVAGATTGSDSIIGSSANETFSLIGTATNLGTGQLDKATGNGGNDLFVMGDSRGAFYKDTSTTSQGTGDFLWVTDFTSGDIMQLKGSASTYVLNTSFNYQGNVGTGIFVNDGSGSGSNKSGWDSRDELIGFIQGSGANALILTSSTQFIYA